MKRGDVIFLRRPKRLLQCKALEVYEHYPAVKILRNGHEIVVARSEVISESEGNEIRATKSAAKDAEKKAEKAEYLRRKHARLVSQWEPGMTSVRWNDKYGWNIGEWQIIRALKRAEIIS